MAGLIIGYNQALSFKENEKCANCDLPLPEGEGILLLGHRNREAWKGCVECFVPKLRMPNDIEERLKAAEGKLKKEPDVEG